MAFPLTANGQNGITSTSDLNNDGKTDLLWYNAETGQTVAWLMDGTTPTSSGALLTNAGWKIIKTADFNGDGMADLVWYNAALGETVLWLMNGNTMSAWTTLLTDPDWKVIEAADLNGDRKADLVWHNEVMGQTAAWLMNGSNLSSWTVLITDYDWSVVATADFNGDGRADLLWHNDTTGQTAAWLMNGTGVFSWSLLFTDSDWQVVGTGDFNGDRMADLLWFNETLGQASVWLMNGTTTTMWAALPPTLELRVAAIADLNGDGKSDIVWRNPTTGQSTAWLMNGASTISSSTLMVNRNWSVAATGDLNRDGKSDLLWYNSVTGQTSAWLMNGTSPIAGTNLVTDPNGHLKCIKSTALTSALTCNETVFRAATGSMPVNQAPLVNAGADRNVVFATAATLSGSAADDGFPIELVTVAWTQISGPGAVTFGNPLARSTSATFPVIGTYTLRLTASDQSLTSIDDVVINAGTTASANQAPLVNAGTDQTVTLQAGVILLGAITDDGLPNNTATSSWVKLSGPGTVVFGNAAASTSSATFSAAGTYVLRLTGNDGELTASDDAVITVNAATAANQAPSVNAGTDKVVTFPAAALLTGTAIDDGLPTTTGLTVAWSKVSGPDQAVFNQPTSRTTAVTLFAAGTYVLRFTATDGVLSSYDDVVVVSNTSSNNAPIVNAGSDQTLSFTSAVNLSASASDDGFPTGSSLSYSWTKINGPGFVTFGNAAALNTGAMFSLAGSYTLRFTANDSSLAASDDVVINLTSGPVSNQAPLVSAGLDQNILFPNSATLSGGANDDGLPVGNAVTVAWSKVSGPGTVVFVNANSLNATATFQTQGTYVLQLAASDGALSSSARVTIVASTAPVVSGGTVNAASCQQSDVQAAVNAASNGDTVSIPSCPGGVQWTGALNVAKAITIQGTPCTLDSKGRPNGCSTVIIDGATDWNAIIRFTLVANQVTRLSNVEIRNGGLRPPGGANAIIQVQGQGGGGAQDNRRFRVDHSRFIQLTGLAPSVQSAWGVIDHNYYELKSGSYFAVYFYQPADFDYADARWAEPTNWGSDKFLFLENNTFTRAIGSPHYALVDAYGGAKLVVRFNDVTGSWIEAHGTESSGRARGTRAVEAYKNNFIGNNTGANIVNIRSGPVMAWGNASTGYMGSPTAANLNNERTLGITVFGVADGTNPWDANGATAGTFTAASASTATVSLLQTVRVNGVSWATNQWRGYSIHKTGCISPDSSQPCGLLVLSNTADTITYSVDRPATHLDIPAGAQFTLSRINHVLDGPCRSGGTLLSYRFSTSMTASGTTATVTLNGHGFSTGDYVAIWDTSPEQYRGTFQITVTGANTFTYTMGAVPGSSSNFASVTKVPAGWNNQVTDPCYQWLNTENGSNTTFGAAPYNLQIRANEQFYDYEPSKTFDGTIGSGKSSVGVGPLANRPATCTIGVGYWATDDGEWDSTHAGADGRLYRCTAANVWSMIYVPAAYPLPLTMAP